MTATLIASVTATSIGAAAATITVPAGVNAFHLCVLTTGTDNAGTTTMTVSGGGWTTRVQNPAGQNNEEFSCFTRMGLVAGNTFTVTPSTVRNVAIQAVWYDTGGQDIASVGSVYGRGGTSLATVAIPSVTTTAANQSVIIVASERTTAAGTVINSWSPTTPTQDAFKEDSTSSVSLYCGHLTPAAAGATGTITATYNSASGNGLGFAMLVAPAAGASLSKTKVGATTLASAYVGSTAVSKMYVGSTQVFP